MADFDLVRTERGDWLLHAETHNLYQVDGRVAALLSPDSLGQLARCDLAIVEDDLVLLERLGQLGAHNRNRLAIASPLDGANLALNINLTSVCNLGCTYCFAEGGDYGRIKGRLNANQDIDTILEFVFANTIPGESVRFEFFGGEPMLNFDSIEALCHRSAEIAQTHGLRFHYRISTNLTTRLTERELLLFDRFGFTVSVSIDGGAATHNRNRPNLAGRGSFAAILENCRKVRSESDAITLVARMTYVPVPGSSLIADVRELHGTNLFDWFQVLPATISDQLVKTVFGNTFDGLTPDEIRKRCAETVDREFATLGDHYLELFEPGNRFRGLLEIETIVRMILKGEVANGHCSGGRNYFTFSPDRSIMPCHRLVGEAAFQAGSFGGDLSDDAVEPWRRTINDVPVCRDCAIRYICGGGCKQENFVGTGVLNSPDPDKCRFQFRLVAAAIRSIVHGGEAFRDRKREVLSDLFVSCGRPTLPSGRPAASPPADSLMYLRPLPQEYTWDEAGRGYCNGQ